MRRESVPLVRIQRLNNMLAAKPASQPASPRRLRDWLINCSFGCLGGGYIKMPTQPTVFCCTRLKTLQSSSHIPRCGQRWRIASAGAYSNYYTATRLFLASATYLFLKLGAFRDLYYFWKRNSELLVETTAFLLRRPVLFT